MEESSSAAGALRHKRVLIAVRLVFAVLLASLALPAFAQGRLPGVVPVILLAYLATSLTMIWEKGATFFLQRIQGSMLIFDIFVLVLALAFLEQHREELFLAMFLVVLLASSGQRLSTSIGGFVAVASFYTWFGLRSPDPEALTHLAIGLPVLLVVAIYVGYVSEGVARERRQRQEMQVRLHQELRGMNRVQSLASMVMSDLDAGQLFSGIALTATELLGAPVSGVFWIPKDGSRIEAATAPGFPAPLLERLKAGPSPAEPLARSFQSAGVLRITGAELSALGLPAPALSELLLAPIADRISGIQGSLLIGWPPPHPHLAAEEEAVRLLVQQASLLLENSTLYRMLAQTRDIWQAAFQSIPTPVVIVDGRAKIVQVNPSFLQLGEFDFVNIIGSSFSEVLSGATFPNGRPATGPDEPVPAFDAARLSIPRLGGDFDVTRGPFFGSTETGNGTVWVLRKLSEEVAAG